jgi:NAD+ kinase
MKPVERAAVFTHRRPDETRPALGTLMAAARAAEATLCFSPEETAKHGLQVADGLELESEHGAGIDIAFALGGDGTILTALRAFAGTGVPVFGVNFGEIGFLSTVERESAQEGFMRAFAGDFDILALPAITISGNRPETTAMNDVSINRRPGSRVASLAYSVGSYEIGRVRCDGLVVATPAGSTGYNLANGGPVMAWGVEGFAVSFVAPHSLTARSLVVAPGDVLTVHNRSSEDAVDVSVDGRPAGPLDAGGVLELRFAGGLGCLAQLPGVTFYQRLREKFGRLATVP